MADKIRINASDIQAFLDGDATGSMDDFINKLERVLEMMKDDGSPNVVFGEVILVNDLEAEDEADDESEDETDEKEPSK